MSEAQEYAKMKVAQLKELLQNRGLSVQGKKAELVERLEAATGYAFGNQVARILRASPECSVPAVCKLAAVL